MKPGQTIMSIAAVLFVAHAASAAISVQNHGFMDGEPAAAGSSIPGWDASPARSSVIENELQPLHPTLSVGDQWVYLITQSSGGVGGVFKGSIEQALPAVWQNDSLFEVRVLVGKPYWRTGVDPSALRIYAGYIDNMDNRIQVDSHTIAFGDIGFGEGQGAGTWTDVAVSFAGGVAPIGSQLYIGFESATTSTHVNNASVFIDNIRVVNVPEPASIMLMGMGSLLMIRHRRRG